MAPDLSVRGHFLDVPDSWSNPLGRAACFQTGAADGTRKTHHQSERGWTKILNVYPG